MNEYKEKYEDLLQQYGILQQRNQDLVKRHIELEDSNADLRKYHKEVEEYASRVYNPNQLSYKELENKLALAENSKQAEIDELYETKIGPMQKKIEEYEKSLQLLQSMRSNDIIEIKDLKKIIKDQETIINYAAGYISSCEQFKDKYPYYVKNWLSKGLE